MGFDVPERPETAFRHLVMVRVKFKIADSGKDVDQLALDLRLEHIRGQGHRIEVVETEFLPCLAEEGFEYAFTIADMTAYGSVPVSRKQVLGHGTLLQVQLTVAVEDMQMDDRMKRLLSPVTPRAGSLAENYAMGVHDREHFRCPEVRGRLEAAQDRRRSAYRIYQLNHI
jgi:hypothetical protein